MAANRMVRMTFQTLASILAMVLALQASRPPTPVTGLPGDRETTTPIKHLVVIFQENESFDHYFGVYPHASNPPGEPVFDARPDTPSVDGLSDKLLAAN